MCGLEKKETLFEMSLYRQKTMILLEIVHFSNNVFKIFQLERGTDVVLTEGGGNAGKGPSVHSMRLCSCN